MKRGTWIVGFLVAGAIGWYLFRPELLFVHKRVNFATAPLTPTS